jgi:hypothetical protein
LCSDSDDYLADLGGADAGFEGAFGKIVEHLLLRFEELLWKLIRIRNNFEEGVSLDGQVLA